MAVPVVQGSVRRAKTLKLSACVHYHKVISRSICLKISFLLQSKRIRLTFEDVGSTDSLSPPNIPEMGHVTDFRILHPIKCLRNG